MSKFEKSSPLIYPNPLGSASVLVIFPLEKAIPPIPKLPIEVGIDAPIKLFIIPAYNIL